MNKRILTMLMALAMLVSIVPMAAMAEEGHEHNYVANSNGDGTHDLSCDCGLGVEGITCLDSNGDGKCDSCGYVKYTKPEDSHEHNYVAHSNGNGTHDLSCNCGLEVKGITCLDNDGDGKCDSCGYQKYVAPNEPHEHNYVAHSNNNGTHTSSCTCGLEVKNITCLDNDGDGKCDSCGYVKYVAPEEPEKPIVPDETPDEETTTASTYGLDSVPKTGDNSAVILMGGMLCAVSCGAAAVYVCMKKRSSI